MGTLEMLKEDHRAIMDLVHEIINTSERPTTDIVEGYFIHLKAALSSHLLREDEEVYQRLGTHQAVVADIENARQVHKDIEDLLSELTSMSPAKREWSETIHAIDGKLERHIAHEENVLFPLLHSLQNEETTPTAFMPLEKSERHVSPS